MRLVGNLDADPAIRYQPTFSIHERLERQEISLLNTPPPGATLVIFPFKLMGLSVAIPNQFSRINLNMLF